MNTRTKILNADNQNDILEAVSMIKNGQVVAVPTETVYGLAADARNIDAVKKIFTIKNRPANHPLIVHIYSFEQLAEWAKDIPPITTTIANHFWPGPLTLLLKKNDSVSDVITGGLKTIAIRVPQNRALLKMLHLLNTGLAAPSANPYKRISPTTAQHVLSGLSGKIEGVLDGGLCQLGVESTILDVTENKLRILRPGPITKRMIENVVKESIESPLAHSKSVPGNVKAHYQPYTSTCLMNMHEIQMHLCANNNEHKLFGLVHYSELNCDYHNVKAIKLSKNKTQYSRLIYQALHELDQLKVHQILVEAPPNKDEWNDILDRLSKASTRDVKSE